MKIILKFIWNHPVRNVEWYGFYGWYGWFMWYGCYGFYLCDLCTALCASCAILYSLCSFYSYFKQYSPFLVESYGSSWIERKLLSSLSSLVVKRIDYKFFSIITVGPDHVTFIGLFGVPCTMTWLEMVACTQISEVCIIQKPLSVDVDV